MRREGEREEMSRRGVCACFFRLFVCLFLCIYLFSFLFVCVLSLPRFSMFVCLCFVCVYIKSALPRSSIHQYTREGDF